MPRRFPYRIPHVSVWRRATDSDDAAWKISYRDPISGRVRYETGPHDVKEAARYARDLSRRIEQAMYGDPAELRYADAAQRPIAEVVEEYRQFLAAEGRTASHVQAVAAKLQWLSEQCQWRTVADMQPQALVRAVAVGREKWNWSAETVNKYLKAAKQFSRHLAATRCIRQDPLQYVSLLNVATDPRHPRRALTSAEADALLAAARNGPLFWDTRTGRGRPGMKRLTGEERYWLYLTALNTGFRRNELASLVNDDSSFQLHQPDPTITVAAAHSKHRRTDIQLIRRDFAASLAAWLAGRPAGVAVWSVPKWTSLMISQDLRRAGVEVVNASGCLDFHSLRHTYITRLLETGASTREAQVLGRLSDLRLISRYGHVSLHSERRALAGLPPVGQPDEKRSVG